MKKGLIVTVLILLFSDLIYSQQRKSLKITRRIESYLTELEKLGFSGSILLELDGEKVISKGYGFRNVELKERNTSNTIFDIGSLTKQFTATSVLKSEMLGKLSVSDTITKFFDTSLIATGYQKENLIWGKPTSKEWDGNTLYLYLLGNRGILSTSEDLCKWHKSLMTETILPKKTKEKLHHPSIRANENNHSIYADGWDVFKTNRNTFRVWHNGTNNIFYADFMRFIDKKATLILMSNKTFRGTDQINFEIAKIIFYKNYKPSIPKIDNPINRKFSQEIVDVILNKGLDQAKLVYKNRPSGTEILDDILNRKGYDQLSQNKFDEAIHIFTMNYIASPDSFNAFDSLAESFMNMGDKAFAIKNYKISFKLDPTNTNAAEMIDKLKLLKQ